MILSHIVACAQNRVIGKDNNLPWDIPEDMEFFKTKTRGHIMIMGRKTFESLPGILINRALIIITRDPAAFKSTFSSTLNKYEEKKCPVIVVTDIKQAYSEAKKLVPNWKEEVFIIGGGEIYKQTLNDADLIYLTLIHKDFEGQTTYPEIDSTKFKLIEQKDREIPVPFSFLTYKKI